MSFTKEQVIASARRYVGVPFGHLGHFPPGVEPRYLDCDGLITRVGQDVGAVPADFQPPYHGQIPNPRLFEELLKFCDEIPVDQMRPGDFVALSMEIARKIPTHLGVVTEDGLIQASVDRVVETGFSMIYRERIVGVYRLKGMTE